MWTEIDEVAAEVEMGEMLYGLVRMLKPKLIVETGTYKGHTAAMLAKAVRDNGVGYVVSCDIIKYPLVDDAHEERLHLHICSSLDCGELPVADFVFSDSDQNLRQQEYALVKPGCVFVVHDTHRSYTANQDQLWLGKWVLAQGGLIFPAGRGFGILMKP